VQRHVLEHAGQHQRLPEAIERRVTRQVFAHNDQETEIAGAQRLKYQRIGLRRSRMKANGQRMIEVN
jgi:hypothetical protein